MKHGGFKVIHVWLCSELGSDAWLCGFEQEVVDTLLAEFVEF